MLHQHTIIPNSGEIFSVRVIEQPQLHVELPQFPASEMTESEIPADVLLHMKQMQAVILDAARLQAAREALKSLEQQAAV